MLNANEKNISVSVKNLGVGIPAHEFENIFQPFYRIEENRVAGGFGLGLSLAKRIVKLHNGEISVYSKPGEETIFTLQLSSANNLRNA